jgi:hypothetical protein
MSCSAVTRRASAIRCVRDARARQAHLLETRASGGAVRQVVRRPALALTWQPAFVAHLPKPIPVSAASCHPQSPFRLTHRHLRALPL